MPLPRRNNPIPTINNQLSEVIATERGTVKAVEVTSTAQLITASKGRTRIGIQTSPLNGGFVFIGFSDEVSASELSDFRGWRLAPNKEVAFDISEDIDVWLIGDVASQKVTTLELR